MGSEEGTWQLLPDHPAGQEHMAMFVVGADHSPPPLAPLVPEPVSYETHTPPFEHKFGLSAQGSKAGRGDAEA